MGTKKKSMHELLDLFSDLVSPEDVVFAKLSAEVSTLLSKERIKRQLTQEEFAALLGVKQSQISKWEHGTDNLSLKTISRLASKLDLDISINAISHNSIRTSELSDNGVYDKTITRVIKMPPSQYKSKTIKESYRGEITKIC